MPEKPGVADSSAATALDNRLLASAPTDTSVPAKFEAEPSMPLLESRLELRAALKDETPRALPEAARPTPQNPPGEVEAIADASPAAVPGEAAANRVWPAGYTPAEPPLAAPRAATQCGPPPWPMGDVPPPRTHVVVDGDSLAKLAGRYLDDPRRSDELFAINRAVLSDPELLPIGIELKIPNASRPPGEHNGMPTSAASRELSVHAAANSGLVPVRPIPAMPAGSPRAELLRPLPAE
jgi:nucleoid-associated protein YgaU